VQAQPTAPAAAGAAPADERVGFANPYTRYVMAVLFLVYVVSYIDRQLMAVLLDPIKTDVGASDTQMGLLTGVAFAIFYSIFGIPIARWADRGARRTIIALGVAFWSAMTALTGLARSYAEILVARIGVGVGEAGGGAPGHALISDYFPSHQRATALALYSGGGTIGIMLGLLLGGWLGDLYGWRRAFLILGLPGIVVALLVGLTVREPPRGRFDPPTSRPAMSVWEVFRYLWTKPSYRWLTLAATLHVFAGFGASNWNPSFLRRIHGMSGTEVGLWLGPISGLSSLVGSLVFARLGDLLGRRDPRWYMWLPMMASLATMPFSYGFVLAPERWQALALVVPAALLGNSYTGITFAMAQGLAQPHMRTQSAAAVLFAMNLFGLGAGPFAIGVLNDLLGPRFGIEAIRVSLLIIGVPHIVAAWCNWRAARTLREDLANAPRPETLR
jgi:predicted MFS family arabinose efflux permease